MAFLDKKATLTDGFSFLIFGFCLKAHLLSFCLKNEDFANFNLQINTF
jgi:hypothetical protein